MGVISKEYRKSLDNLEMIMGVISKEYRKSLDLLIDDIAMLEMMPGIHRFLDKQARHFYVRNTNHQDHTRYEE